MKAQKQLNDIKKKRKISNSNSIKYNSKPTNMMINVKNNIKMKRKISNSNSTQSNTKPTNIIINVHNDTWKQYLDVKSRKKFWFNPRTKKSQWSSPIQKSRKYRIKTFNKGNFISKGSTYSTVAVISTMYKDCLFVIICNNMSDKSDALSHIVSDFLTDFNTH
eukprot:504746_1